MNARTESLQNLKAKPGCRLAVMETETRDAIVTDQVGKRYTIAYVAIGAEAWGPMLAAAPEMAEALRSITALLDTAPATGSVPSRVSCEMALHAARTALAKAGL